MQYGICGDPFSPGKKPGEKISRSPGFWLHLHEVARFSPHQGANPVIPWDGATWNENEDKRAWKNYRGRVGARNDTKSRSLTGFKKLGLLRQADDQICPNVYRQQHLPARYRFNHWGRSDAFSYLSPSRQ